MQLDVSMRARLEANPEQTPGSGRGARMISVGGGKGGVGKSTFAVNLACSFEQILSNGEGDLLFEV